MSFKKFYFKRKRKKL